jgi:hypothetical protein
MKQWVSAIVLTLFAAVWAAAAANGPQIQIIDNKLSVTAEAVSLSRLLHLLDQATGMKSKVPAELANRNISVRFSGLAVDDGVRKIFQGQPIDYIVVPGQGIIVTAISQSVSGDGGLAPQLNQPPQQPQMDQPFVQDSPPFFPPANGVVPQPGVAPPFGAAVPNQGFNGAQQQPQQQPAVIQTPFGPIPNPRANQPMQPSVSLPGQQQNPFGQAAPPPFGVNSPFGAANPTNPDIFGNAPMQNQNQNSNSLGMPSSPPGSFPGLSPAPIRP